MKIKSFQPTLIKALNWLPLRGTHQDFFSLSTLLDIARKRSGLTDYGEGTFLIGLKELLESFATGQNYHVFGRFYIRQMMIAMLVHRLKQIDLFKKYPEINKETIVRPIIILGLPRSGTTLLFNLLALDTAHRFMPNWEAFIGQVPPAGNYSFENDPRRNQAKWLLRIQKYLTPGIDTCHSFGFEKPEECTPILMQSFSTQAFVGSFDVPDYSKWLDAADHNFTYEYHQRVLKALQWKYPGERWLMKSPDHLAAVDSIVKTYPDACIVHIHRDPVRSVTSWASLNLVYRGACYTHVDTKELGDQVLARLSNDMDSYINLREQINPNHFFDVGYEAFLKNPMVIIQGIYDQFGLELTLETKNKITAYLEVNPKNKYGSHHYELQDFNLSATKILNRFGKYRELFGRFC